MLVGTHDGHFHCDDVMCYAILKLLFEDVEIIRTRDKNRLKKCDILFDIGDEYNPGKRIFDHHFVGAPLRPNGVPYAAAGLVWRHYGFDLLLKKLPQRSPEEIEEIHYKIDRNIMQSIDAHDTHYAPAQRSHHYTISQMISSFLPSWKEYHCMDERFIEAGQVCAQILENNINYLNSLLEAEEVILKAYQNSTDPRILVFDYFIPVEACVAKYGLNVDVVVYHVKENEWLVQSVFRNGKRKLFPEEWAGKKGKELDSLTQIDGCIFCHPARFAAGHTTKEGAILIAKLLSTS